MRSSHISETIDNLIVQTIKRNEIGNWLKSYPWLKSHIGNPLSPIWFVAENPSLSAAERVHNRSPRLTSNLQWNAHAGDWLFRKALSQAGLKMGDPRSKGGWKCYITDIIKEPEIVKDRNIKKRDSNYWKKQSETWLPVFLEEIKLGRPRVLVAVGKQAYQILRLLKRKGIALPPIDQIQHYSYIMFRPDVKRKLGPAHPIRQKEFVQSIKRIRKKYYSPPAMPK